VDGNFALFKEAVEDALGVPAAEAAGSTAVGEGVIFFDTKRVIKF
jgi:hypothetical protein